MYAHTFGVRVFHVPVQPDTALPLTEQFFPIVSLRTTARAYSSKIMPDMDLDRWVWASVGENGDYK